MEHLQIGGIIADIEKCNWWNFGEEPLTLIKPGLTLEETMAGKVTWKCPILKRNVSLKIDETNDNGYIKVECLGVGCKHLIS